MSMDICPDTGLSVADNVNDLHGPCTNPLESTHHEVQKPPSVDKLSVDITEFLKVQVTTEDPSKTTQDPKKCLSKYATFPCKTPEVSTQDDNHPSSFRSISLPTHVKAVSAMKGSREKRGEVPPVKLRVKWAPDVYDPIPTSVSHVVSNNRSSRHSSSKKNSRNKQKNGSKSSRGSKGKDKKQVRKRGGNSSSMGYKISEHEEEVVVFHESDFHVDKFCGSSFLKRYGTSLHISSVAEAT